MDEPNLYQHTLALQAQAASAPAGVFEVLAITAGQGNGWHFSPQALRGSLSLWEGVPCFIDHSFAGRSVRDLAGVVFAPQWDEEKQGIRLKLRPLGPSAELLRALGREMLEADPKPQVGFSADLQFSAQGNEVKTILKVYSLDLVIHPARGGVFLRALHSYQRKELQMSEQPIETRAAMAQPQTLSGGEAAPETSLGRPSALEISQALLETALAAAGLPAALSDLIRGQFGGRVFDPAELNEQIARARQTVAELTAGRVVQGTPGGRIGGMVTTEEQLQTAVDDLFGAPRNPDQQALRVHKLSGIRELYLMLTGDYELRGGYDRSRVALATTADFTGLVKNALNKIVVNKWEQLGRAGYDWWSRIVTVEHFNSLQSITGTLVGTVGALPEVAEGGEYPELVIGDSPETASWKKYGGYIPLTLELIDRDETRKLAQYPRELAAAGLRKISALVAEIFTLNGGVGPTMADGGALFNTTAVTTAGGHANLRTAALSPAEWDAVQTAVYNQPLLVKNAAGHYGTGPKLAVNPRYLLVPRALQLTAMKILYPSLENAANIYSENMQRGQPGDVITVPEWTDANDWAAVCDPLVAPAIFVGERFGLMPEIYIAGNELSPAVFTNDEHRLKVRHFLAVWVNDFRPLHKSNVA